MNSAFLRRPIGGAAFDLRAAIEKVISCAGYREEVYAAIAAIKAKNDNNNKARLARAVISASGSDFRLRSDAIKDLIMIGMPETIYRTRRKIKTFSEVATAFNGAFETHHWAWLGDDSCKGSEASEYAAAIQESIEEAKQANVKAA